MRFIQVIQNKKFTLIALFLLLYVSLNFLDGERGLISYFEKQKIKNQLEQEKEFLVNKLARIEKQNNLLTETLDLDYLEILYRKKFMYGKSNEQVYLSN